MAICWNKESRTSAIKSLYHTENIDVDPLRSLPFWLSYPLTNDGHGTGLEVGTVNVFVLGVLSHVLVGLLELNQMSRANER